MKKYTLAIYQDTHPVNLNKTGVSPLGLTQDEDHVREILYKADSIEVFKKIAVGTLKFR